MGQESFSWLGQSPTPRLKMKKGLSIKAKLARSLPARFRTEVYIPDGAHSTPDQINKQLRDKERVCAALENPSILHMVDKSLAPTET